MLALVGLATVARSNDVPADPTPLSPRQSLRSIHVREGFEVELMASEPMVQDPVAIAWGPDGRMWVAEMADYPYGMDGKGQPGGRIRVLADDNGDGYYDHSTVFLDGVSFPNGIMPWRNGVLVTAAPEVFYAEDTDGDGRADKKETLLTGFFEGNQQLRVNGLRWGFDNRVYCAIGSHHTGYAKDSRIRSIRGAAVVDIGSRDFRFDPDTGELDAQSGPTQFGRNRDDWGNWFGTMNSHPLWHYVLHDHYVRRNPFFTPPDPRRQLIVPRNPKVYPAKDPQKRFHSFEHARRFTSACSGMIYRDRFLFPQDDWTHSFVCEPFHNLVQHNLVAPAGISFTAKRDPKDGDIDFFASRDRWCRPVMVRTGPDGALWIVDMYRYMIEHPDWLTPEGRAELKPNYRSGEDQGRIYRVYPKGSRPRVVPNLAELTTTQLVAALDSPSGWQRDVVQQMLIWRGDPAAKSPLEATVRHGENPLSRAHALCALDGLEWVSAKILTSALADEHPGVRRQAVRLCESRFDQSTTLTRAVARLVDDSHAKVRFQVASSLGQWPSAESGTYLGRLAVKDGDDAHFAAAILSSVNNANLQAALNTLLAEDTSRINESLVAELLALSVAMKQRAAARMAITTVLDQSNTTHFAWKCRILSRFLDAIDKQDISLRDSLSSSGAARRGSVDGISMLMDQARRILYSSEEKDSDRIAAIGLLAREADHRARDITAMGTLLNPHTPPRIQKAIVSHLGSQSDRQVASVLLEGWHAHGPTIRAAILDVLATRREWLETLLDAIEDQAVSAGDIGTGMRQRLKSHPGKEVRERLARLFEFGTKSNRSQVIEDHRLVLTLKGDPRHGAAVFMKQCAVCHELNGNGFEIGPDLNAITDKKSESLLRAILAPSESVEPKFMTYVAVTTDGHVYTGMLQSETANSITLVASENKRYGVLRSDLEELRSTGQSLMPDGLERELTQQDIADVIAYVQKPGAAESDGER